MANFQVTAANLRSGAEQLQGLNTQFKSAIEQLTSTENSLSSMWEGDARDAFHTTFEKDRVQFQSFYDLILKYIAALSTIATNYEKAEQTNVSIASN